MRRQLGGSLALPLRAKLTHSALRGADADIFLRAGAGKAKYVPRPFRGSRRQFRATAAFVEVDAQTEAADSRHFKAKVVIHDMSLLAFVPRLKQLKSVGARLEIRHGYRETHGAIFGVHPLAEE